MEIIVGLSFIFSVGSGLQKVGLAQNIVSRKPMIVILLNVMIK
jgi:hypothetical protein